MNLRPQYHAFLATSADGFIAGPQGELDWLPAPIEGEDFGYGDFYSQMHAIVMGHHTYKVVTAFPDWPYGEKPLFVLSRTPESVSIRHPSVQAIGVVNQNLHDRLLQQGFAQVYVDGGLTVQEFLAQGILDTITITTILDKSLGNGIPLFHPMHKPKWILEVSREFPEMKMSQSRYRIHNSP